MSDSENNKNFEAKQLEYAEADVKARLDHGKQNKDGFLPIETNGFDRFFISVVLWVAISLFWLRFIEPLGLSVWFSLLITLPLGVFIIRKG